MLAARAAAPPANEARTAPSRSTALELDAAYSPDDAPRAIPLLDQAKSDCAVNSSSRRGSRRASPVGATPSTFRASLAASSDDEYSTNVASDERALIAEVAGFETLEKAFRWAVSRTPKVLPDDVIVQDEYSHDVLFRVADDCYLVFDTT